MNFITNSVVIVKPRSLSCLKISGSNYALPFYTVASGLRWLTCLRTLINTKVESEAQLEQQQMRLGLSQTVPISCAVFNGLCATSVPLAGECSGWFQVHFANGIRCVGAAAWRNSAGWYIGSDPIFTFMGVDEKLLFATQWKLCQRKRDAREHLGLFSAAWP